MTPAQLQTLKTYINSVPAWAAMPNDSAAASVIADELNVVTTSPVWTIWRGVFTADQMRAAITSGITQVDGLTGSKRDTLLWWAQLGTYDARLPAVQGAIEDLTGSQQTLKTALQNAAKRPATLGEKVLSTGTGTVASPATSSLEGRVNYWDVQEARSL